MLAGVGVLGASVVSCGPVIGLVVGSIAAPIAVALVRNWQRRRRPGWDRAERDRMPLVLDLVAASLRAGQPLDAALVGAMGCAGPWLAGQLGSVAARLRLGAEPADAWRGLVADQRLRPVTVVAIRSSTSGIKLAAGFTELAVQLRAGAQAQAQAQAHRAGVWAIAPLGLCFPPAFVCLGIAPVVIGLAGPLLNATNPSAPPKLSSTGDVIGQSQGSAGVVRRVETGPVGAPTAQ